MKIKEHLGSREVSFWRYLWIKLAIPNLKPSWSFRPQGPGKDYAFYWWRISMVAWSRMGGPMYWRITWYGRFIGWELSRGIYGIKLNMLR